MNNKKITIKSAIFLLCILLFIILFSFWVWQGIYLPRNPNSKELKMFLIEKGEGTREISSKLEKQGLIKSGPLFRIYTLSKGISGKLQAGEYMVSPAMAVSEIAGKFVNGDIIKVLVTVPEGFTLSQIEERLIEKGLVKESEIKNQKAKIYKEEFNFLRDAPEEAGLEGFLFPDTYQFSYDASAKNIIRIMLNNFSKKLTLDLQNEISRQGKSTFEIITMASLIEKEVKNYEDKRLVSGILWKRLAKGMPLQVDSTISYIIGKKSTEISIEETRIDSPYNTYKYRGLPLGPISNPGLESIKAALYPESSEYWFYLSTPEGQTIFSKTFEEHNIAKNKYLNNTPK